jgi:hypothetical protein
VVDRSSDSLVALSFFSDLIFERTTVTTLGAFIKLHGADARMLATEI